MAKSAPQLEWCIVRLGEDHNWWVEEVSDPVRWDVEDGLSIIDPRQVQHIVELVEAMREYGFDQDVLDAAFIPFRIEKDLGNGRVRLSRVKDSVFESEERLFALPDLLDEENGPYADFLDHITRLRVKMLNDLFDFEQKLTIDEVEDEIREARNIDFMDGKAVHVFTEITAILDYTPAGWEGEDEEGEGRPASKEEDELDDADLPDLDEEEEERLKNDQSLKWDEDEEEDEELDEEGNPRKPEDKDGEKEDAEEDEAGEDEDDRPQRRSNRDRH